MPAERVPLAVHLDPPAPPERTLWDRYVELVEAAGEPELVSTNSGIAFRALQSRFARAFFESRRLELWFDLPKPVPERQRDERFREVWRHSRTTWVHRPKIERPDELDRKLAGWLAESWRVYANAAVER